MCREVSDNERLEHRLENLERQLKVNESVHEYFVKKMQEQLELLEERVAELEKELLETQDFRHIPQKNRLKLVADQREGQQEESASEELISVEE